jgi:methylenetetrahydrofolate reductase (NADPH)
MASESDLVQAIRSFVRGFSIEATPHDAPKIREFPDALDPGTRVYVAHPPGLSFDDVVDFCDRLRTIGMVPVPHVIARKVGSRDQLIRSLRRLQSMEIDHALCIAGDIAVDDHVFDSSLDFLRTGLLQEYGFRHVGIAGHPEGSKAIGDERARQFLLEKFAYLSAAPLKPYIVTQFGFDPEAFTRWDQETSKLGIDLPIHVGMAGPASIRQLVRFAAMCGVGASARLLMKRTGATANLLRRQAPDDLIVAFARYNLETPDSKLDGGHFFAFGGVAGTGAWANRIVAGKFELNKDATGFSVSE